MLEKFRHKIAKSLLGAPANSLGTVTRNYGRAPVFVPQRQVTGITYKAIDKTGQSLSVYEPIVQNPKGEPVVNHPLYVLYNNPNPNVGSASDFIHLYAMLYEIYGETFWYKVRGENTRKIKEVYLLPPDRMEVKLSHGELVGYVLHKANGEQVPFMPEEIYHDKRPNPFNEWRGMSVLEKAAVYVETEINVSHFTLNYIRNSASPSGIVTLPDMDREAFKSFAQQWREGYEGPENAGKTAFVRGSEAKFQAVGSTLKDIDQKITKTMAMDDVLLMLEVPKPLLGMTDDKGFGRGNLEALYYIYSKEKIEPMMRRLDRIYEHLGSELVNNTINVTHKSIVPEDKDHILTRQEKGTNVWMTIDEARALDGLDPLPNGAGSSIVPKQPAIQVNAKSDKPKTVKVVKKVELTKAQKEKALRDEQEAFRKNLIETNEIYAKKFKSKLSSFLANQEDKVISNINTSKKAYEEWLFSVKEEAEAMEALLMPVVLELMEAQGEDVAHFITGELLTISPEKREAVSANIKAISGVFNADTITALEKTLSEGQTAGESLTKLKKRVESAYSDAKGYRAERIARTETLKASNLTAEDVYKQNGYTKVAWFTNPGACEFCQTFEGREKTIGGNFLNIGDVITGADEGQMRIEYDNIPTPPLHPNCTCSLVPAQ